MTSTINGVMNELAQWAERSKELQRRIEAIWKEGKSCYGLCRNGYVGEAFCPFYMTEKCPIYQARMRRQADEVLRTQIGANFARSVWPEIDSNLNGFKRVRAKDLYNWMKSSKQGIYVHGEMGCGKTYLLARLLWVIAYKGEQVIYRTKDIDEAAYHTEWLLLDELFTFDSQKYRETVWDMLDYRYRMGLLRTTVIASNLTPEEIGMQDARLADRLFSRGQMRVLHIRREDNAEH